MIDDNWKSLVEKYGELIGRQYLDKHNVVHTFNGLLHAEDDYYYVMYNHETQKDTYCSCVGRLEDFGYKLIKNEKI